MDWFIRECKKNGDVPIVGAGLPLLCLFQIKLHDSMILSPEESKIFVLLVVRVSSLCVTNIKGGIMPIYAY